MQFRPEIGAYDCAKWRIKCHVGIRGGKKKKELQPSRSIREGQSRRARSKLLGRRWPLSFVSPSVVKCRRCLMRRPATRVCCCNVAPLVVLHPRNLYRSPTRYVAIRIFRIWESFAEVSRGVESAPPSARTLLLKRHPRKIHLLHLTLFARQVASFVTTHYIYPLYSTENTGERTRTYTHMRNGYRRKLIPLSRWSISRSAHGNINYIIPRCRNAIHFNADIQARICMVHFVLTIDLGSRIFINQD